MIVRRLCIVAFALLLLLVGSFWTMSTAHAGSPTAPVQPATATDCVARSAQGQQTLQSAMAALLGDDPAGSQFTDATAFVTNEVIVGSTLFDIDSFIALGEQLQLQLAAPDPLITVGDLVFQRFVIGASDSVDDHTKSVRRIICEVDKLRETGAISPTGYAEPNYRISASQWWAAGSRWRDDNLSEYMLEHTDVMVTDFATYTNQWAWGANGINLQIDGRRAISQTGLGSRVVLFDSSPFAESGPITMTANVAGQNQDLFAIQTTERLPQTSFANSAFPDHGPFVAGLVNAVAPAANLELVGTREQRWSRHLGRSACCAPRLLQPQRGCQQFGPAWHGNEHEHWRAPPDHSYLPNPGCDRHLWLAHRGAIAQTVAALWL
ncbi:MAG: hypothetical protein R2867_05930 [Caldilineaceae bacterium]